MADDDDDQNPDAGSAFLKNHMTEAQPSTKAGGLRFGRNTATKGTDMYYANKYGRDGTEGMDGDSTPVSVNRPAKGDKSAGSVRGTKAKTLRYD